MGRLIFSVCVSLMFSACGVEAQTSDGHRFDVRELAPGIQEVIQWPCGPAEYFGFLDNEIAVVSCQPGPTADFAFVDLRSGVVLRHVTGPPTGIVLTSGLWSIGSEDYWALVIGRYNLHLAAPEWQPEIQLYHPDPNLDRQLAMTGISDLPISAAYINGIAGCAIFAEASHTPGAGSSHRMILTDTMGVATAMQLRANTIIVDPVQYGRPPSRLSLNAWTMTSSSCARVGERVSFFIRERQHDESREHIQLSRIVVDGGETVAGYEDVPVDTLRWTAFFQTDNAAFVNLAVEPVGSERLTNMSVGQLTPGEELIADIGGPMPNGWRWAHFSGHAQAGLGIPRDYRSEGRNLLLATCEAGNCEVRQLPVRLASSTFFLGSGRLEGRQVLRSCIEMPNDDGCRLSTLIVSMTDEIVELP